MGRVGLHPLFAPPPVLVPVPLHEALPLTRGDRVVWHKPTEEYGCWTCYGYRAVNGPYLRAGAGEQQDFVVDVQLEVDFYRAQRGEPSHSPAAVPVDELWRERVLPNDGYDPAEGLGPIPTEEGRVAGHLVPAVAADRPPVRRLALATSVSGIVGRRAWLMPVTGEPATPGYRVVSEPFPYDVSQEYAAMGLDETEGYIGVAVALAAEEHWWAAQDRGRPLHPDFVIKTAYLSVLLEPA